ncbi:hypothetical protein DICA2_F11034 [Diutina catenulata]
MKVSVIVFEDDHIDVDQVLNRLEAIDAASVTRRMFVLGGSIRADVRQDDHHLLTASTAGVSSVFSSPTPDHRGRIEVQDTPTPKPQAPKVPKKKRPDVVKGVKGMKPPFFPRESFESRSRDNSAPLKSGSSVFDDKFDANKENIDPEIAGASQENSGVDDGWTKKFNLLEDFNAKAQPAKSDKEPRKQPTSIVPKSQAPSPEETRKWTAAGSLTAWELHEFARELAAAWNISREPDPERVTEALGNLEEFYNVMCDDSLYEGVSGFDREVFKQMVRRGSPRSFNVWQKASRRFSLVTIPKYLAFYRACEVAGVEPAVIPAKGVKRKFSLV